jgi:hypothetical protein
MHFARQSRDVPKWNVKIAIYRAILQRGDPEITDFAQLVNGVQQNVRRPWQ